MSYLADLAHSVSDALRLRPKPWGVTAAMRAVAAAGAIAVTGAMFGHLSAVGVVYLGAACSVAFVPAGVYRVQAIALLAQGAGAMLGICAGNLLPTSLPSLVASAVVAGTVSGLVGSVGPNAPGFGMMLSIGLAFGQFGGSALPWWQQSFLYFVGLVVVAAATLAPWVLRRNVRERQIVAAVYFSAADLCAATCTTGAAAARARLAAASADLRAATPHPKAELLAYSVAALYAEGRPVSNAVVDAIRTAGSQVLADVPVQVQIDDARPSPGMAALQDALSSNPQRPPAPHTQWSAWATFHAVTSRHAQSNGIRIGVCMGVATALTATLHEPTHSFWLPLTVAVIVRPEYASIFVRTVNRLMGTIVGALVAAGVLSVTPAGLPVAAAAALALGFAVLSAPKQYGLSVIGVTASALLSSSIGQQDPVLPGLRLVDTLLGATIAVVFGYLLWPTSRQFPEEARLDVALTAAHDYFTEAVKSPEQRTHWQTRRDDAYRLAHQAASAIRTAISEPPPLGPAAARLLPAGIELEDTVTPSPRSRISQIITEMLEFWRTW